MAQNFVSKTEDFIGFDDIAEFKIKILVVLLRLVLLISLRPSIGMGLVWSFEIS